MYEHITYGEPHISIATLPGMADRTVTLSGFTKAYAMDGWRVGYAVAPADILAAMLKITARRSDPRQHLRPAWCRRRDPYGRRGDAGDGGRRRRKRDLLVAGLNRLPGVRCAMPAGTIYAFADIRGTGLTSQEAADRLLDEAGVVVESGRFYGAQGEGYLRICFGSRHEPELVEALRRMEAFFSGLGYNHSGVTRTEPRCRSTETSHKEDAPVPKRTTGNCAIHPKRNSSSHYRHSTDGPMPTSNIMKMSRAFWPSRDVTKGMYRLMTVLREHQPANIGMLAELALSKRTTVSRIIDRMLQMDLLAPFPTRTTVESPRWWLSERGAELLPR